MYELVYTHQFKRSLRRCAKRGLDLALLKEVVETLRIGETLPERYKAHRLSGRYAHCWECHIQPNWLLLWEVHEHELRLILLDTTGTHADIF